jgi:hypothetical protein
LWYFLSVVKDFVASINGICGTESEVIVNLRPEKAEAAIVVITRRGKLLKSTGCFMFELSFQGVTFRLFSSGKLIFRGVKNRSELDRLLAGLLL